MLKRIMLVLICLMLLAGSALAENYGVTILNSPEEEETVTLEDIQLDSEVKEDGFGTVKPTDFFWTNWIGAYEPGGKKFGPSPLSDAGAEAEYAVLQISILNNTFESKDYLKDVSVKVVYCAEEGDYEFGGWAFQHNHDYINNEHKDFGYAAGRQNVVYVISREDQHEITPFYEGHYSFGCTLPNFVITDEAPMYMVVTIGQTEIIYNIRK